jgi:hypothetical protein
MACLHKIHLSSSSTCLLENTTTLKIDMAHKTASGLVLTRGIHTHTLPSHMSVLGLVLSLPCHCFLQKNEQKAGQSLVSYPPIRALWLVWFCPCLKSRSEVLYPTASHYYSNAASYNFHKLHWFHTGHSPND